MPETMTEPTIETLPQAPICATQKCKRPLTFLGPPQNCWRCLVCNPIRETKPTEKLKKKYIDVTITDKMVREIVKEELQSLSKDTIDEEKIREIVMDEMANWHIQKPPATRDEITEAVGAGGGQTEVIEPTVITGPTWRQRAKELSVPLNKETGGSRLKVDVLADIEAATKTEKVENEAIPEELRAEEQAGSGGG